MTEPQLRALALCEINFYKATVSDSAFRSALVQLGWKPEPSFDVATVEMLQRLSKQLRSMLRNLTI